MGEFMTAVRRVLATAGLAALLLVPAGSAWADPTPSPDPSATATAAPSAAPTDAAPSDAATPSESPGGCDQNPQICQSGGAPATTTDCGQVGSGGQPAS